LILILFDDDVDPANSVMDEIDG